MRTSQLPLLSTERSKFQPCAPGSRKTDLGAGVSILQLPPGNQLRAIADFSNHHLHRALDVGRLPDANNSEYLILKSDIGRELLKLFLRQSQCGTNFFQALELRVVLG